MQTIKDYMENGQKSILAIDGLCDKCKSVEHIDDLCAACFMLASQQ